GAMEAMRCRQRLFAQTGATHGAALFDAQGEIVALGEDIARHNALDKAIGRCLLVGLSPLGCAVALSGRVSFELVAKSARAGIELISAISAPSSLAIEAAERSGITLCAFVRGGRTAVYCHPERIRELPGAFGS
ncbi:MAG: formate dehydrogenase accessory sulfurtransferase FdhD, partial [candidate division NC10 bacterium]|nr:formate dehydrogenase accessory sulfurtransferase FdhD [candidate division NC10 bacterium]